MRQRGAFRLPFPHLFTLGAGLFDCRPRGFYTAADTLLATAKMYPVLGAHFTGLAAVDQLADDLWHSYNQLER